MSLSVRLVVLVLVAAVPVFAVQVYDQFKERREQRAAIATEALRLADLQAERLSQVVELARGLATSAALMPEISPERSKDCETRARQLLEAFPDFIGLGVIAPDGNSYCRSSGGPSIYIGDRPYFQEVVREKRFVASGYMIGRAARRPTVVFAAPALDEAGDIHSVVIVAYALDDLAKRLDLSPLPSGASLNFIDPDGVVVARIPPLPEQAGSAEASRSLFKRIGSAPRGTILAQGHDGVARAYGYASLIEPARFRAVVGLPLRPATAAIDRQVLWSLALLAAIFTAAAVAALVGGELGIRRPLSDLQRVARALAAGDLGARTSLNRQALGEVGALAASFDDMADAISKREAALAASEEFNRRVLESSRDCIKVVDLEGRLQSINQYGRVALEIDKDQDITRANYLELLSEDSRPLAVAALDEARAGGTGRFHGGFQTRSGRETWWDIAVTPIKDASGRPERLLVISRDMTEAKRAEAQREMLMAELDHRVKNTLAAVQSIAWRTLRSGDGLQVLSGRIGAMAKAHELISRRKWEGAELSELMHKTLEAYGRRIELAGPEVALDSRETQTIAMVVHELATNAAKYGALSVPTGSVHVAWWIPESGADRLVINWVEHNGPVVEQPRDKGFGLSFVEKSIAHELDGQASFDFRPDGLQVRLETRLSGPARSAASAPANTRSSGTREDAQALQGKRILVVEDSLLIAMQTEAMLDALGCVVVGPAGGLDEGLRLAKTEALDAALLDVNLNGDDAFPIAAHLAARSVPFVFLTGYSSEAVYPAEYANIARIGKPINTAQLVAALSSAML